MTSDAAASSTGQSTAVARAPILCGRPRTPVATSSSRSGSTLARCAETPKSAPAAMAHVAGSVGSGRASVATAGSAPKATAYGRADHQVPLTPRLYAAPAATTVSDATAAGQPSASERTTHATVATTAALATVRADTSPRATGLSARPDRRSRAASIASLDQPIDS